MEYSVIRTSNQFVLTELNRKLEEQLSPEANGNSHTVIRTSNQFVLTELNRMLEEQLSPQANGNSDTAVDGTSGEIEREERRSTRVRQASVVRDREGDLNEKKLALQKSCAGHIGNLTKVHNEISRLMESNGSSEEVLRERMKFSEAWRKFVDAHESYLELLDRRPCFGKGTNDLRRTAETKARRGLRHAIMAQV